MCGRFVRAQAAESYSDFFGVPDVPKLFASFNVAPTQPVLALRAEADDKEWSVLRWGLIPFWAKDMKTSFINARAETLAEKPAFRAALKRRRCLVIADGYYEWKTLGPKKKQPYYFRMKDEAPFAFAGIWDKWQGETEPIESCSLITTSANELSRAIHDRMPVMLRGAQAEAWIDPAIGDPAALVELLQPYPAEQMTCYAVGQAVGSVKNNGAQCIEPLTGA